MSAAKPISPLPGRVVAILLCSYNGQRYLAEQLDSIAAQTHRKWRVWVSDDGSTDATLAILERYQADWGPEKLVILQGPRKGSTCNFMALVHDEQIQADYYAFCDQDDIWEADKLQRAIQLLDPVAASRPALYGSRTRYVDAANQEIGLSQRFHRKPGFANALTQNIAGGNTMLFNHAACQLLRTVDASVDVVVHDWWAYLAISACNGQVIYDPWPSVRYRQHDANQIGMNVALSARLLRIRRLVQGDFKAWSQRNIAALRHLESHFSDESRRILAQFAQARERALLPRLVGLHKSGIYRQTLYGNLGLVVAAVINKL